MSGRHKPMRHIKILISPILSVKFVTGDNYKHEYHCPVIWVLLNPINVNGANMHQSIMLTDIYITERVKEYTRGGKLQQH